MWHISVGVHVFPPFSFTSRHLVNENRWVNEVVEGKTSVVLRINRQPFIQVNCHTTSISSSQVKMRNYTGKIMQIVKCLSFFEIKMTVPEKSTMNLGELKIMDFWNHDGYSLSHHTLSIFSEPFHQKKTRKACAFWVTFMVFKFVVRTKDRPEMHKITPSASDKNMGRHQPKVIGVAKKNAPNILYKDGKVDKSQSFFRCL